MYPREGIYSGMIMYKTQDQDHFFGGEKSTFQEEDLKKNTKNFYESFHIFGKNSILISKINFYEDT